MNDPKASLLNRGDYIFLFVLITGLTVISRFNYVLFHSLVEIAITTIGFMTFAFTWHLRRFESGYLLLIGILLGCTAFISVFHLLAYKGMGVFSNDPNLPTQLWIASRYQLSLFLLGASLIPKKSFNPTHLITVMTASSLTLILVVFAGHFPDCFIAESGQTDFKITSEYVISGILITSMGLFWKNRRAYTTHTVLLIMFFFGFSILSELVFTSYLGVYDLSNMLGHIFHMISSYFLYKAIVETGLENPFDLMFLNLNKAVQARDEFISMASHELKTPLTPLKLQLQMFHRELEKNIENGIDQTRILKISSSTNLHLNKLNQLIDGMLDVSRLSTGRFEIFREKIQLSPLISDLAKRHEPEVTAVGSTLTLKLAEIEIEADPIRIEQVITNLLVNAVKYAPASSVEIGIEKTQDKVRIWVKDSGPGISHEFKEKIFNRYERGVPGVTVSGLGLGLFISQQIIEAHGGSLSVESELNQGSCFTISL